MAYPYKGNSSPGWLYGYTPSALEWNTEFAEKQDFDPALTVLVNLGVQRLVGNSNGAVEAIVIDAATMNLSADGTLSATGGGSGILLEDSKAASERISDMTALPSPPDSTVTVAVIQDGDTVNYQSPVTTVMVGSPGDSFFIVGGTDGGSGGGQIIIQGGVGGAGGAAGNIGITAGSGAGGTAAGNLTLSGGGQTGAGNVGNVTLQTQDAFTGSAKNGGTVGITTGAGNGAGSGGQMSLTTGNGGAAGAGGDLKISLGTGFTRNGRAYLSGLGKTDPGVADVMWINGGFVCVSPTDATAYANHVTVAGGGHITVTAAFGTASALINGSPSASTTLDIAPPAYPGHELFIQFKQGATAQVLNFGTSIAFGRNFTTIIATPTAGYSDFIRFIAGDTTKWACAGVSQGFVL